MDSMTSRTGTSPAKISSSSLSIAEDSEEEDDDEDEDEELTWDRPKSDGRLYLLSLSLLWSSII